MASQQPRPMFRFASMLRPAAPPQPPAPATAPPPMFRPPVATPFRPPTTTPAPAPPPQTREPSPPPQPPPSAPAPPPAAPAPSPQPPAAPPAAPAPPPQPPAAPPAPPSPVRTGEPKSPVSAPQQRFSAPTSVSALSYSPLPPSPKTETQVSNRPLQFYEAPKPPASSRSPPPSPRNLEPDMRAQPNQYSPKIKPVSPLKLPPAAQIKTGTEADPRIPARIDQKTVVVQETAERNNEIAQKFNGPQMHNTGETDWTGKREAMMTKDKGGSHHHHHHHHHKKRSDTDEPFGISVITLAGENKGAIMELNPAGMKQGFIGIPRRLNEGEKSAKESDEEEGKSKMNKGMESTLPMTAFTNSNVQGINNSILHNASCTHHNPGVHLVFSRNPTARHAKDKEPHRHKA